MAKLCLSPCSRMQLSGSRKHKSDSFISHTHTLTCCGKPFCCSHAFDSYLLMNTRGLRLHIAACRSSQTVACAFAGKLIRRQAQFSSFPSPVINVRSCACAADRAVVRKEAQPDVQNKATKPQQRLEKNADYMTRWLHSMPVMPLNHSPESDEWSNSIAICAIMRDENVTDVTEWLKYYMCASFCTFKCAVRDVNTQ
jgi:hypothetical protein